MGRLLWVYRHLPTASVRCPSAPTLCDISVLVLKLDQSVLMCSCPLESSQAGLVSCLGPNRSVYKHARSQSRIMQCHVFGCTSGPIDTFESGMSSPAWLLWRLTLHVLNMVTSMLVPSLSGLLKDRTLLHLWLYIYHRSE